MKDKFKAYYMLWIVIAILSILVSVLDRDIVTTIMSATICFICGMVIGTLYE